MMNETVAFWHKLAEAQRQKPLTTLEIEVLKALKRLEEEPSP